MTNKSGSVAPQERINIKYVPSNGDQPAEVELPLKLLVTGDFKGHAQEQALEERQAVRIDKDSFDAVLSKAELKLDLQVPSVLGDGDKSDTLEFNLQFNSMNDFSPDAIAKQIPALNNLLELREALVALKGPLGNAPAFRKQLQTLLADEQARNKLTQELGLQPDQPLNA